MRAWILCLLAACGGGGLSPSDAEVVPGFDAAVDAAVDADLELPVDAAPPDAAWARYTELVDPFIGTTGASKNQNCFPGAVLPWGMVAVSPDTRPASGGIPTQNHAAGYLGEDELVVGFTHNRLQGTSTPDLGSVLVMPAVGEPATLVSEEGYRSPHDKSSEVAEPGYYAVTLTRPDVRAELTATRRAALHRYSFQGTNDARVVVDLGHAMVDVNVADAAFTVDGATIEGFTQPSGRFSGPSPGGLRVYFSLRFEPAPVAVEQTGRVAVASFAAGEVLVSVGLSYVDVAGARANREVELGAQDFETIRAAASDAWQDELTAVRFEGGSEAERTIMATALYHSFVVPTQVTDVDGRYRGYDNAIHTADFDYHTNFSMWDTYRTVHPLLSLVRPDRQRDLTRSLIQMAREGGYYPRWSMGHGYPNITAGSPGAIVVAESILRGADGLDANEALDLMFKEIDSPPPPGHGHSGREGLAHYLSHGYVPVGTQVPGVGPRVVVRTLEYHIADLAIANLARALGRDEDATRAQAWADGYTTLWDPSFAVFRGRFADGSWWGAPFDPFTDHGDLYYGANARQYAWLVPQDPHGFVALHGTPEIFAARLDEFFTAAEAALAAGQRSKHYTHENEPDIHAMYLFLAAGRPDLAQKWIRWAAQRFYAPARDGLPGNEDAGTLSAWYVLSAIGLFPVTSTDVWWIGRPAFPRTVLRVAGGDLVIEAPGAGVDKPYVQA
jgi:predicted alpha-1,2-mannosidase